MNIDILSVALPNSAAATESAAASPEAPEKGDCTFAALLDAVAGDTAPSKAGEPASDEESTSETWLSMPVVVPFIPPVESPAVDAGEGSEADPPTGEVDATIDAAAAPGTTGERPDATASTPSMEVWIVKDPVDAGDTRSPAAPIASQQPDATVKIVAGEDEPVITSLREAHDIDQRWVHSPSAAPANTVGEQRPPAASPKSLEHRHAVSEETSAAAVSELPPPAGDDAIESPTAGAVLEEAPVATDHAPKGTAARFARALERAADPSAVQRAAVVAAENGQSFDPSSEQRQSLGEWLREQLPLATPGRAPAPSTATFSVAATSPHAASASPVLASRPAGPELATALLPEQHDVTSQLVQSLRVQFRDGIGEAVLRLKPEHLGAVAIALRVENGGLKASVQAELPAVRQWLESQQDTLRSALAEHDLRLDRFDVDPERHRQSQPDDPRDEQMTRRRRRHTPAQDEQPVFEIVV